MLLQLLVDPFGSFFIACKRKYRWPRAGNTKAHRAQFHRHFAHFIKIGDQHGTHRFYHTEFERGLSPQLAAFPDARVSFQSQQGGGPDADSRDIMVYLGGDDPDELKAVANQIAKEMETVKGLRAPRVGSSLAQPEITIKPRFDLAADLGVTTMALSQTIRIATLGDIEQNSAKFSLSDRQVPITVSLSEGARRDIQTLENLPVPTSSGGSVPLKSVADIGFGSGPTTIQRSNQIRRLSIGADLAPGLLPRATSWRRSTSFRR